MLRVLAFKAVLPAWNATAAIIRIYCPIQIHQCDRCIRNLAGIFGNFLLLKLKFMV